MLHSLDQALENDGEQLLTAEEITHLREQMSILLALRNGENASAIEQGVQVLAQASDFFAARRMDQSIKSALQGHSIDEIEGDA